MRKKYLKLTKDQKDRGIIFSSTLISDNEDLRKIIHEVKETDPDKWDKIDRLLNDKFFNNSPFKYNEVRR